MKGVPVPFHVILDFVSIYFSLFENVLNPLTFKILEKENFCVRHGKFFKGRVYFGKWVSGQQACA